MRDTDQVCDVLHKNIATGSVYTVRQSWINLPLS